MPSQYHINGWSATPTYEQYDVVNGGPYYYATQRNVGQNPSGTFTYNITSITSDEDVSTVRFTQTGNVPNVAPGSIVMVAGTARNNYTGMAIAGGSGWLQAIIPNVPNTEGAAGTVRMPNPAWSTGFFFVPAPDTNLPSQNDTIVTQLGGGYSQRMSQGLNTFTLTPTFVYKDIGERMTKAIVHFAQDNAGVAPFEVLIPDQYLSNQPHHKYTAQVVDPKPVGWKRYDVTLQLQRVFDP